jgi:hypothetical protein
MKKSTLLLFVGFFFSLSAIAQVYVIPKPVGTYSPASCTNTVVLEGHNITSSQYLRLTDELDIQMGSVISLQDTLYNFCSYVPDSIFNNIICVNHTNGYNTISTIARSTIIQPHYNYSITSYTPPSSDTIFDGSLTITFDSASVFNDYSIYVSQNSVGHTVDTTFLDAYSLKVDSLKKGYVAFQIWNPSDTNDYCRFTIYLGNPNDVFPDTGLVMSLSLHHASNTCEGWINLAPVGTTYPTYNAWSDGPYNQTLRSNLCPGVYSAYSYEMNGNYVNGSIDTIVITNANTSYIDSSIFLYTPQDTSYYFSENCFFDYQSPIDSVLYTEDTVVNNGGVVIVNFTMTVYQGTNYVTTSDSLVMINDSIIFLDVSLYCDDFKSTFRGQHIVYLRGAEEHHFYQTGLGFEEETLSKFELFPNPTNELLTIRFETAQNAELSICDLNGSNLFNQSFTNSLENTIKVADLPTGIYFLKVTTDTSSEIRRFVKN